MNKIDQLEEMLRSFICEAEDPCDRVDEDDIIAMLTFAEADDMVEEYIRYITDHPKMRFDDLLCLAKPGIGPDVDMEDLMT